MTNGNWITRDELAAHIRRIDESLTSMDRRMQNIEASVGSGQRWLNARVTILMDRALPVVLTVAATYLLTH